MVSQDLRKIEVSVPFWFDHQHTDDEGLGTEQLRWHDPREAAQHLQCRRRRIGGARAKGARHV